MPMIRNRHRRRGLLLLQFQRLFSFQDHITPFLARGILADALVEYLHPTILVNRRIGIEVNDFAVFESDAETLFDEHVAFFFFREARLATATAFSSHIFLGKCSAVVYEFAGICEVDGSAGLSCGLMIGSEFAASELEVSSTPELYNKIIRIRSSEIGVVGGYLQDSHHPAGLDVPPTIF